MKSHWKIKSIDKSEHILQLSSELGISEIVAKILTRRDIDSFDKAKDFFRPDLNRLHSPFLMKDMDLAVARILKAIEKNEKIAIYGDYDVDGTTSVSFMYLFLSQFTTNLITYIPDRYSEGYGISKKGVAYLAEEECGLMIALDCGIQAIDQATYAKQLGMDLIICDHHLPSDTMPDVLAVLDPKRSDCTYPFKELSGCGIGFKLACGLLESEGESLDKALQFIDLVAISLACDIVPLVGENRILVKKGLEAINTKPRKAIALLLGQKKNRVVVSDLVFQVGPKINAAGRLKHGSLAVDLLISKDEKFIENKASEVIQHNEDRKETDKETTKEALQLIKDSNEQNAAATVVLKEGWHKGVIGIVASRLQDQYYRPTIVLTKVDGKITGSARSVKGFDIHHALQECAIYLEQFGGHKYAAGMSILPEKFEAFKKKFNEVIGETLPFDHSERPLEIDSTIEMEDFQFDGNPMPKLYRIVKQMEPFGPANMKPTFMMKDVLDSGHSKIIGSDQSHLRLSIYNEFLNESIAGVAFNMAHCFEYISSGKPFDVVFTLEENVWNGKSSFQLMVKDISYSAE